MGLLSKTCGGKVMPIVLVLGNAVGKIEVYCDHSRGNGIL